MYGSGVTYGISDHTSTVSLQRAVVYKDIYRKNIKEINDNTHDREVLYSKYPSRNTDKYWEKFAFIILIMYYMCLHAVVQ